MTEAFIMAFAFVGAWTVGLLVGKGIWSAALFISRYVQTHHLAVVIK